jgi:hypothetical protein
MERLGTVFLSPDPDDNGILTWSGYWDRAPDGPPAMVETSPDFATPHEGISWGLQRSWRIWIRVDMGSGVTYWAGEGPPPEPDAPSFDRDRRYPTFDPDWVSEPPLVNPDLDRLVLGDDPQAEAPARGTHLFMWGYGADGLDFNGITPSPTLQDVRAILPTGRIQEAVRREEGFRFEPALPRYARVYAGEEFLYEVRSGPAEHRMPRRDR